MTKLFEPITIRNMKLKNRIIMAPMCMYSCDDEDGKVMNWHTTHYTSRAVGQVALIILEATAVRPEGRISVNDLGIWNDEHVEGLQKLTALIKEQGAKTGIQLAHAGRKSLVPEETFAPSAIPFDETIKTPTAMTVEHIQEVIQSFKDGAVRAKKAGFDVIEIHAAHGYLLNSFLSPLTNKRTDAYGGSPENRYRILREIIDAIRSVWDQPLFVRISAHDYTDGGMTAEQYVQFTTWMKTQDVDLIDVSSGAVVPAKIDAYPGYQVPFAETIKRGSGMLTGAVGLITSGEQAEEILKNDRADVILIGRELLRDPYWPYTAAQQLKTSITPPKQYDRGWML